APDGSMASSFNVGAATTNYGNTYTTEVVTFGGDPSIAMGWRRGIYSFSTAPAAISPITGHMYAAQEELLTYPTRTMYHFSRMSTFHPYGSGIDDILPVRQFSYDASESGRGKMYTTRIDRNGCLYVRV